MQEHESPQERQQTIRFDELRAASLRSNQLNAYIRESELFRERVKQRIASGEEILRVPFGFHDSRHAIVDLRQLRRAEEELVALITNPGAQGYLPTHVYGNLKVIHHFLPTADGRLVQETENTVNALIRSGIPPFRFVPTYDAIEITPEGRPSYFPIQDYLIYFGAGLLGIQAKERRERSKGPSHKMLPVNLSAIRLFAQKAIVNGTLDPVVAKHLLRVSQGKFESDSSTTNLSQRMLRQGDFLASTLKDIAWAPKSLLELPVTVRPSEAYQTISSDPYWYLYYSEADRIRIAEAYVQLQKHEDMNQFSAMQLHSFHQAASLILDSLPEPAEILQAKRIRSRTRYEDATPEELRTMVSRTARENGWEQSIADDVLARLRALDSSTPLITFCAIFFGPQGSVLRAIDLSGKLDTLAEVKIAIDQGRIDLLRRLDGAVLGAIVKEAFRAGIVTTRLKFCGGAGYRQFASTAFSELP
jgi:hypothetical protein